MTDATHDADDLSVDPDIRRARTIPSRVYTDPSLFALQRERVLARAWLFAGLAEQLKEPGHVLPIELPGVAEPVLLVRDQQDRLRAMSNVCTHRGNLVCGGEQTTNQLRCRYHGRRFALDGRMTHAPEFDGVLDFPAPSDDLPPVPFAAWNGVLFAGVAPACGFEDWVAPLRSRLDPLPWAFAKLDLSSARDYVVCAHWALYVENYLEGFHIPYVHASLSGALDYGAYTNELYPWGTLQLGIASSGEAAFELPPAHPDAGRRVAAYYYWLYPSTMVNVYPWGVSLNVVIPIDVNRTKVRFIPLVWDPSKRDQGAGAGLDRVEREDESIVEAVQKGVGSRAYDRGRYSATREQGVHHFHRLLAGSLAP